MTAIDYEIRKDTIMAQLTRKVAEMLYIVRPDKKIRVEYVRMTPERLAKLDPWYIKYHRLIEKDEYMFVWDLEFDELLYAVNVSGNSYLYCIKELLDLIAEKF